jgi:hypothetical protein
LFSPCSPHTILRAIWAIVVHTLKTQAGGWLAHIFHKSIERIEPAFTDCYASPAINPVTPMLRIVAALNHALPTIPEGILALAVLE